MCEKLRNCSTEIINYKEKEMIPLTNEENKSYERQKVCHICKKEFCYDENEKSEFKLYHKVRDHCHYTAKYRGAARSICKLKHKVPKEISVVVHNAGYDTHFIIKQLAEEIGRQFECIGENTEKYITFSVPIKKGHDHGKRSTCKLKFVDSFRFMPTSLSHLVDNLSEIYKKECKACMERKNIKSDVILLSLKIINHVTNVKNVKNMVETGKRINQKVSKCISILQW